MPNEFIVKNGLISQGNITISGSITATGGVTVSGSIASASYAFNAELLDGLDSTVFTLTSSFNAQTASFTAFTSSMNSFSASILTNVTALNAKTASFATTGSNTFVGAEVISGSLAISGSGTPFTLNTDTLEITGSLLVTGSTTLTGSLLQLGNFTTTGTIIAQTINVQTVTSSIVYSSGSNVFGNSLGNSQTFTGSVLITGSLTIAGASSATSYNGATIFGSTIACSPIGCFATSCATSFIGGTMSGTTLYGSTAVCSPVGKFTSCIDAGAATFSSSVTAGGLVSSFTSNANSNNGLNIVNSGTVGYGGAITFNIGSGGINYNSARIYSENEGTGGTFRIQTANTSQVLSDRLIISNTGAATFSSSVTAQSLIISYSLDGDPVLATFTNANAGPSAEATIYVRNGTTANEATFIQAIGTGFTTTGGFVQDAGIIGTGTALFGGMSLMVRANADMRFYTNGHTNERMRITSGGNVGIGTCTPTDKLHILGADNGITICAATANRPVLSFINGSCTMLKLSANNTYGAIADNAGSDIMFFKNGNIGIGAVSCAWAAPTAGKVIQLGNRAAIFSYNNQTLDLSTNLYFDGGDYRYIQSAYATLLRASSADGTFVFYNAASGTAGCVVSLNERIQITSGGSTCFYGTVLSTAPSNGYNFRGLGFSTGAIATGGSCLIYSSLDRGLYLISIASSVTSTFGYSAFLWVDSSNIAVSSVIRQECVTISTSGRALCVVNQYGSETAIMTVTTLNLLNYIG